MRVSVVDGCGRHADVKIDRLRFSNRASNGGCVEAVIGEFNLSVIEFYSCGNGGFEVKHLHRFLS